MTTEFQKGDRVKYKIHAENEEGKVTDEILEEGEAEVIDIGLNGNLTLDNRSGLIALPEECEKINNMTTEQKYITPEYLLSHGFERYNENDEDLPCDTPFMNKEDLHLIEKDFDRNMFVVIFSNDNAGWYAACSVYVQENAGCGFVHIPFRWAYLSVEIFEALYFSFYGRKPQFTPLIHKHN